MRNSYRPLFAAVAFLAAHAQRQRRAEFFSGAGFATP